MTNFEKLASELAKQKISCKLLETNFGLKILLGFNYPDKLVDKIYDVFDVIGFQADIMADMSGSTIINSKIINGGPKRY